MVISVALWSLELQPGKAETFKVPNDLRITNVALGAEIQDENSRTSVKLTYKQPKPVESDEEDAEEDDDQEEEEGEATTTVLCSLTPRKIEQALVNLILEEEQEVVFEVVGKNTVYLTGNYVDQTPPGGPDNEEDYSDMSDEEEYDIDELDSEVDSEVYEIDDEEDDSHRFEEVVDEEGETKEKAEGKQGQAEKKADSKKRSRESDAMEADGDESKLSKAQKKKLKKLKAENGEAVPTGETKEAEESKAAEKPKEKESKKEKAKETKELAGGIKTQDHKAGTGRQAKNGDIVSMRYVGKLQNGKVFDSNTKGKPFKFRLGKGEVIKGWDVGIAGMQAGGERLLVIPPAMAYGKQGSGPIPPNSTLTFEVKLIGIN